MVKQQNRREFLTTLAGIVAAGVPSYAQQRRIPTGIYRTPSQIKSLYEILLDEPVNYDSRIKSSVESNVKDYTSRNQDIGVEPKIENGKLVGFNVWAKEVGAGYTGMDQDIKYLAKPGLQVLSLEYPVVVYDKSELEGRVKGYMSKNSDIGVEAQVRGNQLTGFYVWAKKPNAGYTGMDKDIKGLVK